MQEEQRDDEPRASVFLTSPRGPPLPHGIARGAQPSPAAPGRYAPRLPAGLSREGAPQKSGGIRGPRRLPSQPHTEVREGPGTRPLAAKPRPQRRGGGKPAASSGPAAARRASRAAPRTWRFGEAGKERRRKPLRMPGRARLLRRTGGGWTARPGSGCSRGAEPRRGRGAAPAKPLPPRPLRRCPQVQRHPHRRGACARGPDCLSGTRPPPRPINASRGEGSACARYRLRPSSRETLAGRGSARPAGEVGSGAGGPVWRDGEVSAGCVSGLRPLAVVRPGESQAFPGELVRSWVGERAAVVCNSRAWCLRGVPRGPARFAPSRQPAAPLGPPVGWL